MMEKKAKQVLALLLALVVLAFACDHASQQAKAQAASAAPAQGKVLRVGILQYASHNALDESRRGFIDGLADQGYVEGENLKINYQNAQADQSNLTSMAKTLVQDSDLILAIATPAAQAIVNEDPQVPILFTAITDPVSAGLVDSMDDPGKPVTGTSDGGLTADQVDLMFQLRPDLKRVGIFYSSSEQNAASEVAEAKAIFASRGVDVLERTVANTNDVQQVFTSLCEAVDMVYTPTDNIVAAAGAMIGRIAKDKGVAVFGGSEEQIKTCGLASVSFNYYDLGRQTAGMAERVLGGEDIRHMAVEYPDQRQLCVVDDMAQALGVDPAVFREP